MNIMEIRKTLTPEKLKQAIDRKAKVGERKSLRKHFRKLKRGFDGMIFQKNIRNDWE